MKTKFDLYKSAGDAAATSLEMTPFETAEAALVGFRAAGLAPGDWEFWKLAFDERREFFVALKGQKAPSEQPAVQSLESKAGSQ